MNYHNINHDDMLNGSGLRITLFVSGCDHKCKNCQNKQTWDTNSGIKFDDDALNEIEYYLSKDYISGITLSGGDPLNDNNLDDILKLVSYIKDKFPTKNIWIYTGYIWEDLLKDKKRYSIIKLCDVLVDGKFIEALKDEKYHWAGSTNQRVIDIKKSIENGGIIEWE